MDSLPSRVVALAPNCSQALILDPAGFNLAAARSTTGDARTLRLGRPLWPVPGVGRDTASRRVSQRLLHAGAKRGDACATSRQRTSRSRPRPSGVPARWWAWSP